MLKKFKKLIPIILLIIIISSLGVLVFGAKEAKAAIEHIPIPIIGNIVLAILELIKLVLSKFLYLSAQLADGVLGIVEFTKVGIVDIGWKITRDIANMFFILILMIIAFATILGVTTYEMKSLLPKLIIAALLINFSLVIAGVIIDFSQVLTDFFIQGAAAGEGVSTTIMKGLQVHTLYQHDSALWQKILQKAFGASFAQIAEAFFAVIILLSAVFAFVTFAFFLIIRIIILWLLLILAPIAWLLFILPKTRHLWEQWWSTFIKWCFFAPIYAFFLYIVLIAIQSKVIETEVVKGIEFTEGAVFSSIFASNPQIILQYIFIILMLFGGLVVAQKLSVYGASGAINIAKGAGKKISGIDTTQRWWKARKSAREDEVKERVKRKAQLRRVGGAEQWRRETLRPTVRGRAEARAKKNEVITNEAKKLGTTMDRQDVQKIAGGMSLTKTGRMQKLAAQVLLADPKSKAYKQMMSRSTRLTPGMPKYKKMKKLARNANLNVARKRKAGEFIRYKLEKAKK